MGVHGLVRSAGEALGSGGAVRHRVPGREPRFELFHAASSICSQKVRAVLAFHKLPWADNELSIFRGDTYLPAYVRLRLAGCARHGGPLVSRHGDSTSIEAGGCDSAEVPTLVDRVSGDVIVDSKRICVRAAA